MALINLRNVSLAYGGPPLFEQVDFQIEPGERVCLVGRNGTGKSTFMKLLSGDILPDEGEIVRQQGLRVARLTQEVPHGLEGTVYDVVAGGLGELGELLTRYHQISHLLSLPGNEKLLTELENIQHALEAKHGWHMSQRIETVISRLALDADTRFAELSGGLKRRVLLAKALVCEPDLLLLDEPTNHLDIASIDWLEEFLLGFAGTLLFVTHDRMLLQKLATRIVDLDQGHLTSWPGDYETYLQRKQALLDAQAEQQALFDKKLAQEETWIRQGIKARRTRNEGRVRALETMRKEFNARRSPTGTARMQTQSSELSGKLVIEAENVSFGYADQPCVKNFSTTLLRGDKVGIIGPNGSGKTTLLRLLLGQLTPLQGTIHLGTRLEIAYFDQHRAQLDESKSVLDNICEGKDMITVNGKSRHAISYLQDFLFSPARTRTPVKALSGGERNRLLLAKLFSKPSNVMVLDEPTNDLDIETLELLEELLMDYPGTLLLVSHDRAFLNNVVTSTLVFEGHGRINEYVGGYDDWLRQRRTDKQIAAQHGVDKTTGDTTNKLKQSSSTARQGGEEKSKTKKLSYKDQRELELLPKHIEMLEKEQQQLHQTLGDPSFYQKDNKEIAAVKARLEALEQELQQAYERWETLEELL